jgi:hypothetical protein
LERKTTDQYKKELKLLRPNLKVIGVYSTNNTKLNHLCVCGYMWNTTPTILLKASKDKCPKCPNKVYVCTKSNEQYKKELETKGCYSLQPYINAHTKILHKCKHCSSEWMAEPRSILQNGIACTKCWATTRKSEETYIKELLGTKYTLVGSYTSALTKTAHQCTKCSYIWDIRPNDILEHNGGCPSCAVSGLKYNEPTTLYFVKISEDLFKVGITNKTVRERFKSDWVKFGIEVVWQIDFPNGKIAYTVEQGLLKNYKHILVNRNLLISGNTETMREEIPCPV